MHPTSRIFAAFELLASGPILHTQVIRVAFHNGATTTHAMLPASAPTTQGTLVNTAAHTWNKVIHDSGTVSGVTYTAQGLNFANFVLRQENGTDSLAWQEAKNASMAGHGEEGLLIVEGSDHLATSTTVQPIPTFSPFPGRRAAGRGSSFRRKAVSIGKAQALSFVVTNCFV